jgi:uncharacterized protein YndB with AHSA1/START domain
VKTNEPPIIVEESMDRSVDIVWKAITNVENMRQWFFGNIPDFEARLGFKTVFEVNTGGRTFTHLWEIIEVVPLKKIVYNWKYKEYPGDSLVTFELSPLNNKTVLKLTAIIKEDFPDTIPEFQRESCQGGWDYFIKNSLKSFLT